MFPASVSAYSSPSRFECPDGIKQVVVLVAQERNVPENLILNAYRCRANVSKARQLAMYLSHVALGLSLTTVGMAFGRDRTTVSYACGLLEDMRDDPAFDREMDRLETVLKDREAVHA